MKWTEEEARLFFEITVWDGLRKPHNWEPAQELIAAIDGWRRRAERAEERLRALGCDGMTPERDYCPREGDDFCDGTCSECPYQEGAG